jgi:Lysine methyltransferase
MNDNHSDDENDSDDPYHGTLYHSIHNRNGLEIGVRITWPGIQGDIELSTCLPETELAPMFDGTQWAGTRVWTASLVGTQYLLTLVAELATKKQRKSALLELGCGLGLPGVVWHLLHKQQKISSSITVLTDMPSLVPQLRQNLQSNELLGSDTDGFIEHRKSVNSLMEEDQERQNIILAEALDWSEEGVQELNRKTRAKCALSSAEQVDIDSSHFPWDIVLCCDCIFEPLYGASSWQQLLICQLTLLQQNPDLIMICAVERRNHDGVDRYLEALQIRAGILPGVDVDQSLKVTTPQDPDFNKFHGVVSSVEKVDLDQFSFDPKPPPEIEIYRIHGRNRSSAE